MKQLGKWEIGTGLKILLCKETWKQMAQLTDHMLTQCDSSGGMSRVTLVVWAVWYWRFGIGGLVWRFGIGVRQHVNHVIRKLTRKRVSLSLACSAYI
jgi:hypothetical protein